MSSFRFRQLGGSRGRTALFVALTLGAAVAAAYIVPAVASGRIHPFTTIPGPVLIPDNVDTFAMQAVVGGQNNATAIEGFVQPTGGNPNPTFDNGILGYTLAGSGNAIIGIAQPSSGTATALVGQSYDGYGIIGASQFNATGPGTATAGTLGQDNATTSVWDSGAEGTTTHGFGVTGMGTGSSGWGGNFTSNQSIGLEATSSGSIAGDFQASTATGVFSDTFHDPASSSVAYGVEGGDFSNDSAGTTNAGVFGFSNFGTGLIGQSGSGGGTVDAGPGVTGVTNNNSSSVFHTTYGVDGIDNDPNINSFDAGVFGSSINGYGLQGVSSTFVGVFGNSTSSNGGAFTSGSSIGLVAETGSASQPALEISSAATTSGEPVFLAFSGAGAVFSIAGDGTTIASGSIFTGTPLISTHGVDGTVNVAYGSRQTRPTIEDVGEANLINGSTFVPIDRKFGSTIDPNASYLVFVTPQGDTQGLYVTGKTHAGFYVREHGGSSDIAFDYRIVAKPAFDNGARLPDIRTLPALARMMFVRSPNISQRQSLAQVMAQDRRLRAAVAAGTMSARQLADQRANARAMLARSKAVENMKAPHIPTPAQLHLPTATTHN